MEKEYYITKEEFITLKAKWASKSAHESWHHIIYNVLRSKDIKTGFAEKTKNIQGNNSWFAYDRAKWDAKMFTRKSTPETFKCVFGIDKPETLEARLD